MLSYVDGYVLDERVDAELDALPQDIRTRFLRYAELIEEHGFEHLPRSPVKHLEGKLWELRLVGKTGIARTIYVTTEPQRVVILRAFVKKTQKTPTRELEIARQRAKEVA